MLKISLFFFILPVLSGCNLSIHTLEQSAVPVDLKTQLQATLIACNAEQFQETWQHYQEINQAEAISTMQGILSEQATALRAQKIEELSVGAATLTSVFFSGQAIYNCHWWYTCQDGICVNGIVLKNKFPMREKVWLVIAIAGAISTGWYALKNFNYVYCANTQNLSTEIKALDAILVCLNPQTSEEKTSVVDPHTLLMQHILACDSIAFAQDFATHRPTLSSTTLTTLKQLAQAAHAQKKQALQIHISKRWQHHSLAALHAAPALAMTGIVFTLIAKTLWDQHSVDPYAGSLGLAIASYCMSYPIKDIYSTYYAYKQQLNTEIMALDEIIACLNTQDSVLVQ